jgi:flagellar biosynthetic protein FlhB
MADQNDRDTEDLSEEASPHKLQEFREQGKVAQSKELTALIALAGAVGVVYAMLPYYTAEIFSFMKEIFSADWVKEIRINENDFFGNHLLTSVKLTVLLTLPAALASAVFSIASNYAQVGAVFSTEPLSPDISRIDPIQGLKRFFTMNHVFESLRILFKALILVTISFFLVKTEVLSAPEFLLQQPEALGIRFSDQSKSIGYNAKSLEKMYA